MNTQEKTNPKLAFGYSLGEVGCQMSWYMVNNYLTLFYTDIVGLISVNMMIFNFTHFPANVNVGGLVLML